MALDDDYGDGSEIQGSIEQLIQGLASSLYEIALNQRAMSETVKDLCTNQTSIVKSIKEIIDSMNALNRELLALNMRIKELEDVHETKGNTPNLGPPNHYN